MNLSYSSKVIKYLMFVFNLIFVITGIIILAVGVTVKTYYYKYDTFLDEKYFSLPNLLIATGSIIFFISFFGCYGAVKENWVLLFIFSCLLVIIFIFEFSAGIAGYVLRDKTSSYLEDRLTESLKKYDSNAEYRKMWDIIQGEFECCGVKGPEDYYPVFTNWSLPITCCPSKHGIVGAFYCNDSPSNSTTEPPSSVSSSTTTNENTPVQPTTAPTNEIKKRAAPDPDTTTSTTIPYSNSTSEPYSKGCEYAFGDFIKKHAKEIGGCAMGLAIVQLIGIIFSCHLARKLKNGYYST